MSCGSTNSCKCEKSCARNYNLVAQPFAANATTPIIVNGNQVVLTGKAIQVLNNGYQIVKSGLYRLAADIVVVGTAAGTVTLQMYLDGVALPCTIRRQTIAASGAVSIHSETDLDLDSICRCNNSVNHRITFAVVTDSAAAGSITSTCTGALKLD